MIFIRRKWIVIFLVLLVALFLRIYKVGSNPPGLNPDEAALGYNAYSILKTGRDGYGEFLPIVFKSFGDYNPGLYVYLDVPFVAILGLTETAVRMPTVISGVIIVYLLYLITKLLFKNEKLAIISMAVAATNPWLIYFSRSLQVAPCLAFTLAGIYFFMRATESLRNQKYLLLAVCFFALTLIEYQGAKLSTGIVVFILFVLYWRDLLKFRFKYLTLSIIIGFIISSPIILSVFNGKSGRLNVFSVFSYPRPDNYLKSFLDEGSIEKGSVIYNLFYNEPLNFFRGIITRFFNHFSGRFLFFEGDWANPRHTPPYQGVLVFGDIIFLVVGVVAFLKEKISKEKMFVVLWMLLATLPAILSRDQVHAVRSFNLAIPFIILIAFGINKIFSIRSRITIVIVLLIYGATYVYFLDAYFVHQPAHNSEVWQYGYKQMVEAITPIQNDYKQIIVQQSYDQPYIYFLFYTKYDPVKWQKQAKLIPSMAGDVGLIGKLDNIIFKDIDWSIDRANHGSLVVGDIIKIPPLDSNNPKDFKLVDEIKYLGGKIAWRVLEIR